MSVYASSSIGFFESIQSDVVVIADCWDNFAVAPVHFSVDWHWKKLSLLKCVICYWGLLHSYLLLYIEYLQIYTVVTFKRTFAEHTKFVYCFVLHHICAIYILSHLRADFN